MVNPQIFLTLYNLHCVSNIQLLLQLLWDNQAIKPLRVLVENSQVIIQLNIELLI